MTDSKTIVIKVGTSTLTYENGKLNLRGMENLCKVISDLQNKGHRVVLVSSGAMGVGVGKLGLKERPTSTKGKQAVSAVGQCELMFMYDKMFSDYNNMVGQILLTKYAVETPEKTATIRNAFMALMDLNVIPVVNENDSVATDELEGKNFGDNDILSAIVADLISADMLIILTDIDGLYTKDPRQYSDAEKIKVVEIITDDIEKMAGGSGSKRGTGGMATKIIAAKFITSRGIDCRVMQGNCPEKLYDVLDNKEVGTLFLGKAKE